MKSARFRRKNGFGLLDRIENPVLGTDFFTGWQGNRFAAHF